MMSLEWVYAAERFAYAFLLPHSDHSTLHEKPSIESSLPLDGWTVQDAREQVGDEIAAAGGARKKNRGGSRFGYHPLRLGYTAKPVRSFYSARGRIGG
jgi:hypothetical protein